MQREFAFFSSNPTDTTVTIWCGAILSDADCTIDIDGQSITLPLVARCQDGEGGTKDSGDIVGLEVGIYSAAAVVSGLQKDTIYPYTVTQNSVSRSGQTNTNVSNTSRHTEFDFSCFGYSQGSIPTSTDRNSTGMFAWFRAECGRAAAEGRPVKLAKFIDDVGYPDGSILDDTIIANGGTGRFTLAPEDSESSYSFAQIYATMLGLMGDYNPTGSTLNDSGFLQTRFSNPDWFWFLENVPILFQGGDHNSLGDQGGTLKDVSRYINARKAWDAFWGLANPTYLDTTDASDFDGNGKAFIHRFGPTLTVFPDREWNSSGPEATSISAVTTGATTQITTTARHYFKQVGQKALLTGVSGAPDINGSYYSILSIDDNNNVTLDLDTAGGGPYSNGTIEGLIIGSIDGSNGDSEMYMGDGQIADIKTAVEAATGFKWLHICSPMEMVDFQAPAGVRQAAADARAADPLNNLGPSRYGSQQPHAGYSSRESESLMTVNGTVGNRGLLRIAETKGARLYATIGDHHHPGLKIMSRPDWKMMQWWTGSVNASTSAQEIHESCLTRWSSYNGLTLYLLPEVDTRPPSDTTPLPLDATKPISAVRRIVSETSVRFSTFNERGGIVFDPRTGKLFDSTLYYSDNTNISKDLNFFSRPVGVDDVA